ncbi:recombinase RecT [uncultured Anaerococcus sp.]|uniref:recombinase RecT n=1 Tax=uncultured Anaerococcus sp. TaxID=293428 RepID=UPI00260F3529|nr:recombinase RecT [uncultured Anaerococcus sp.]
MTNAKQALQKKNNSRTPAQRKQDTVRGLLKSMEGEIKNALPAYLPVEKFIRTALTAINSNPKLASCSQESLLAAIMNSAQLGLEFNTPLGEAYLIPYGNRVNFQLGYQGLLKLAYNTGQFKRITAREVRENEDFDIDYGTGEISHRPCLTGDSGDVIGYYAIYQTKDGGQDVFYFSKADAERYGKTFSQSYNSGPWKTNFDAMAKKSALIQVLKYAPKAIESQTLVQATNFDNANFEKTSKAESGERVYQVDYEIEPEVVEEEEKEAPKNVDKETGEVIEVDKQSGFFDDDFKPVED